MEAAEGHDNIVGCEGENMEGELGNNHSSSSLSNPQEDVINTSTIKGSGFFITAEDMEDTGNVILEPRNDITQQVEPNVTEPKASTSVFEAISLVDGSNVWKEDDLKVDAVNVTDDLNILQSNSNVDNLKSDAIPIVTETEAVITALESVVLDTEIQPVMTETEIVNEKEGLDSVLVPKGPFDNPSIVPELGHASPSDIQSSVGFETAKTTESSNFASFDTSPRRDEVSPGFNASPEVVEIVAEPSTGFASFEVSPNVESQGQTGGFASFDNGAGKNETFAAFNNSDNNNLGFGASFNTNGDTGFGASFNTNGDTGFVASFNTNAKPEEDFDDFGDFDAPTESAPVAPVAVPVVEVLKKPEPYFQYNEFPQDISAKDLATAVSNFLDLWVSFHDFKNEQDFDDGEKETTHNATLSPSSKLFRSGSLEHQNDEKDGDGSGDGNGNGNGVVTTWQNIWSKSIQQSLFNDKWYGFKYRRTFTRKVLAFCCDLENIESLMSAKYAFPLQKPTESEERLERNTQKKTVKTPLAVKLFVGSGKAPEDVLDVQDGRGNNVSRRLSKSPSELPKIEESEKSGEEYIESKSKSSSSIDSPELLDKIYENLCRFLELQDSDLAQMTHAELENIVNDLKSQVESMTEQYNAWVDKNDQLKTESEVRQKLIAALLSRRNHQ